MTKDDLVKQVTDILLDKEYDECSVCETPLVGGKTTPPAGRFWTCGNCYHRYQDFITRFRGTLKEET